MWNHEQAYRLCALIEMTCLKSMLTGIQNHEDLEGVAKSIINEYGGGWITEWRLVRALAERLLEESRDDRDAISEDLYVAAKSTLMATELVNVPVNINGQILASLRANPFYLILHDDWIKDPECVEQPLSSLSREQLEATIIFWRNAHNNRHDLDALCDIYREMEIAGATQDDMYLMGEIIAIERDYERDPIVAKLLGEDEEDVLGPDLRGWLHNGARLSMQALRDSDDVDALQNIRGQMIRFQMPSFMLEGINLMIGRLPAA